MTDVYGDLAGFRAYATERGQAGPADASDTDASAALLRGSEAIDARYTLRFPGVPTNSAQDRAWPRTGATDYFGNSIGGAVVPTIVVNAAYEAGIRELAEAGSMSPDLDRGGAIKRLKADTVEIEYADGAPARATVTIIEGMLAPLLRRLDIPYGPIAV